MDSQMFPYTNRVEFDWDASRSRLMSEAAQIEAVKAFQSGDRQAGADLMEAHYRLAGSVAMRTLRTGGLLTYPDAEDVRQEMALSLQARYPAYRPETGQNVAQYGLVRIRSRALNHLRELDNIIHIPAYQYGVIYPPGPDSEAISEKTAR